MVLSTALLLGVGGAAIGGISGFGAARQRARDLDTQFGILERQSEAQEKLASARKSILAGNISIAALKSNRSMKESAIEAYQGESAAKAAMAGSGLTSESTPAYKLASDIREQRGALDEYMQEAVMGLSQMGLEADASAMALDAEVAAARDRLMLAGEEAAYAESPFAMIMGTLTGAFAGAQSAAGLMSLGVKSGLLTDEFLSSSVLDPAANFSTPDQAPSVFGSIFFDSQRNRDPSFAADALSRPLLAPTAPSWYTPTDVSGASWSSPSWDNPFKKKAPSLLNF